jgi:hypothetical protein
VSGPLDNYVGEITKYVINKAPCRVILTAPPAGWQRKFKRDGKPPAVDGAPLREASTDGAGPAPEQVKTTVPDGHNGGHG